MRILVVEDNRSNQIFMEKILEPFGEIDIAINGAEAIASYEASAITGEPYELIILDIMLPFIDGQSVLSHIRKYEQNHPDLLRVKVVVTTACGDEDTVRALIKYRCDAYMRKPIDRSVLIEKLHGIDIWASEGEAEKAKEENRAKEEEQVE